MSQQPVPPATVQGEPVGQMLITDGRFNGFGLIGDRVLSDGEYKLFTTPQPATSAKPEGDAKDAPNEAAARALYESWYSLPGYVPWQEGGNSFMQDQARRAAIASQKGAV